MTVDEFDTALTDLETRVDRLRALYENWFRGYEKTEPSVARKDVERRVYQLRKDLPRNTALRFRYHQLYQRYTTLATYWQRTTRQIEEGTYKLHLARLKRRNEKVRPARRRALKEGEEAKEAAPEVEQELHESLHIDDLLNENELDEVARALDGPVAPVPTKPEPARAAAPVGVFAKPGALGGATKPAQAGSEAKPAAPFGGPPLTGKLPALPARPPAAPALPAAKPNVSPGPGAAPQAVPPKVPALPGPAAPKPPAPPASALRPPQAPPAVPPARPAPPAPPPPQAGIASAPGQRPAPPSPVAARPAVPVATTPRAPSPPAPRPVEPRAAPIPAASTYVGRPPMSSPLAGAPAPNDQQMRRIYDEYAAARRRNNEGEVRYEALVSSIQKMLPELSKKHQGKQIDFDVVVKDGRVGLKPKAT